MKLKYRIKEYTLPFAKGFYIAQYKILGIWMSINRNQVGRFLKHTSTYCETLQEARDRILLHKKNMERASDWVYMTSDIIESL